MFKRWQVVIFFLILVLAFLLRFNRYAEFPIVGETADEFAWTLLGASLIQTGTPTSWSLFDVYEDYWITEEESFDIGTGQQYPLVSPVFDHPPLFALLPGLAQTVRGQNWIEPASAKVMRLPLLFLGTLNVALLYFVAQRLFQDKRIVYFSVLIYTTAPLFVFSSRLVLAENLLTTLILMTLWVMLAVPSSRKLMIIIGMLSAVAVLTKLAGIVIPATIVLYGITQKNPVWKAGLVGAIVGGILFAAYGAFYDWQLFVEVFSTQANRGFGFLTLHNRLFVHPAVVTKLFVDGWLITGVLALFLMLYDAPKKFLLTSLFCISNLLFILFFVDEQTHYSWYDFPIYPLLALAMGYVILKILTEKRYLLFSVIWLLLLPIFRYGFILTNIYYQALEISSWIGRSFVTLGLLPWTLYQFWPKKAWSEKTVLLLLSSIIIINIVTVFAFKQDLYWATDEYLYYRGFIFPD